MKALSDSIVEAIFARAAEAPERAAFVGRDGEISFGNLVAEVERWATVIERLPGFPAEGVARIGVRCPDGVQHTVLMLAVMRAGGCAVPVAGELPADERSMLARTTALHGVLSQGGEERAADGSERHEIGGGLRWERLAAE